MNAFDMARTAYSSAHTPLRTPRGTEYEAFVRVTRALKAALENRETDFPALARSLYSNRRLWTLLATSVSDDENGLPQELRARIYYLSEFTAHHTSRVLNDGADPSILIEINSAVMRGLGMQDQGA